MAQAKRDPSLHEYILRIPKEIFRQFAQCAKTDRRSVNKQIQVLMEEYIAQKEIHPPTDAANHEQSLLAGTVENRQ